MRPSRCQRTPWQSRRHIPSAVSPCSLGFSVFLLGLVRRLPHVNIEHFLRRLAIFAAMLAVFAVVQRAGSGENGTELVYGFWKPYGPGNIFGPFINRNHFAGWMVMAAPLAIGFAMGVLDRSRPRSRGGWAEWSRWLASIGRQPVSSDDARRPDDGRVNRDLGLAFGNGGVHRDGGRVRDLRVACLLAAHAQRTRCCWSPPLRS